MEEQLRANAEIAVDAEKNQKSEASVSVEFNSDSERQATGDERTNKGHQDGTKAGAATQVQAGGHESRKGQQFQLRTVKQLKELPSPHWVIEDLIPQSALAVLFGAPASGKSFLALDWALSVACGRAWGGHGVMQGPVLYVAAEGIGGLRERVDAWETNHQEADPSAFFLLDAVQLAGGGGDVGALLDAISASIKDAPQLVVFDTLARCSVGADENTARDIGIVIRSADRVRQATGAAVLLIHHMRKDGEQERGSTALRGAADVMLKLQAKDKRVLLTCDKVKDAAAFESEWWRLVPMANSCVLIGADAPEPEELTPSRLKALRVLHDSAMEDGLSTTAWLNATNLPSSTFYESLKALVEAGYVHKTGTSNHPRYHVTEKGKHDLGERQSGTPTPAQTPEDSGGTFKKGSTPAPLFREGGARVVAVERGDSPETRAPVPLPQPVEIES